MKTPRHQVVDRGLVDLEGAVGHATIVMPLWAEPIEHRLKRLRAIAAVDAAVTKAAAAVAAAAAAVAAATRHRLPRAIAVIHVDSHAVELGADPIGCLEVAAALGVDALQKRKEGKAVAVSGGREDQGDD